MTQTLSIQGMMCGHCEAHVKNALSTLDGVSVQSVSHADNQAVIESAQPVPEDILKKAIADAGYELTAVQ